MKLWDLPAGQQSQIVNIGNGIETAGQSRLGDLGFLVGQEVMCLRHPPLGAPRVYKVGDSVISLAKDVANEVEVQA